MLDSTAIVEDATARLVAAGVAGGNVVADRMESAPDDTLPAIDVHIGQERFESLGGSVPEFRVETDLILVLQARQATDADPTAAAAGRALRKAAIQALFGDAAWVQQFERVAAVEVTPLLDPDGARPTGAATVTITLQYQTEFPPTVADGLTAIHADWDMASPRNDPQEPAGPDGQIDAQDDLALPQ